MSSRVRFLSAFIADHASPDVVVTARDVVRTRFEQFARDTPAVWSELAPYSECEPCRHRCQFRGIAEIVGPRSASETAARFDASGYPSAGAERDALWTSVVSEYETLAGDYTEYGSPARSDLAYCLFLHSLFSAFPRGGVDGLARRYGAARAGRERVGDQGSSSSTIGP